MKTEITFDYPGIIGDVTPPETIVVSDSQGNIHTYTRVVPEVEQEVAELYDPAHFEVGEFVNHDGVYSRIFEEPRYHNKQWVYSIDNGFGYETWGVPESDLSGIGALDE